MPGFRSFRLVIPPLARRGGTISGMKYLVPQSFAAGGNWVVSRFFGAVTSGPWYQGNMTLKVLESATDLFVGFDSPGQDVPPHVRYGMVW
jgi:hypothetical protein